MQIDSRRFVNGRLLAFDLAQGSVGWAAEDGRRSAVPFAAFRCLRRMELLSAEPSDSPSWRPPPAAVPFRVEFVDGHVWTGLTFRCSDEPAGLFVAEPVDEFGNLRLVFVPRFAWRAVHVGHRAAREAPRRLGQVLMALGLIDGQQLQQALHAQRKGSAEPLGELLVRQGALTRDALALALATKSGPSAREPQPPAAHAAAASSASADLSIHDRSLLLSP